MLLTSSIKYCIISYGKGISIFAITERKCVMGFKDKLRNSFDIHYSTPEGLKYQIIGEEIKITGFHKKANITEIPAYINGLPVGIISSLQSIPFTEEMITELKW